tara:strand:+ start:205 stop:732 length:528 start_codon:yes stop_codon:yes gene_type:complete
MANGILKVGEITTSSGSGNITIGSGVTLLSNTPAFEAYLSSNQTISGSTYTLTEFDTEVFDTDNAYDNSTNYRFTPQVAGKYFVYANVQAIGSADTLRDGIIIIQKNGADYKESRVNPQNGAPESELHLHAVATISMNGSSDYITVNGYINVSSGTPQFSSDIKGTYFGAYRLGA